MTWKTIDWSDPTYPAYPVLAIIGTVLVLTPFPWHLQAWNAGTCLYMFWTAVGCLITAVNAIVWRNDAIDRAPLWCDISTRLQVGITVGIPAASLCINRRLYKIATGNGVGTSRKDKRNALLIDAAIAFGIPFLEMILQIIVQGHRYDIFEGLGCQTTVVNTPLTYPLVFLWPTIIGIASAVYCILTLRAFLRRRAEFAQFLSNQTPTSSSLTVNRYFRLMALATSELIFNLPLSIFGLYININSGTMQPWISWDETHFAYNEIGTFPALVWRWNKQSVVALELGRWPLILCAFLFFGFFGFAEEARRFYKNCFWNVAGVFGKHPPTPSYKVGSLPSYSKSVEKVSPATSPSPSLFAGWKRFFTKTKKSSSGSRGWRNISSTLPSFRKTHSVASSTVVSYSPYSSKDPKLAPYMSSYSSPPTPTTVTLSPTSPNIPRYAAYHPSRESTTSTAYSSYSPTGAPRLEMPPSSLRTTFDKEYRPNSLLSIVPPPPPPAPHLALATQRIDEEQSEWDPSTPTTTTMSHRDDSRPWSDYSIAAATIASVEDGVEEAQEQERRNWPTPIYAWAPRTPMGSRRTSAMF